MNLLPNATLPNPDQGLFKVFTEYYFLYDAFAWVVELFEMFKSFLKGFVDFFSTKEQFDF